MKRFMPGIFFCSLFLMVVVAGCAPRTPTVEGSLKGGDSFKKMKFVIALDDSLAEAVGTELAARGFPVVESKRLRAVLSEKSLPLSGIKGMDDDKFLEAGKFLKADSLISAETAKSSDGTIDAATVTIVNVESGAILGSFNYRNGRARDNQEGVAKRIADAISRSFK